MNTLRGEEETHKPSRIGNSTRRCAARCPFSQWGGACTDLAAPASEQTHAGAVPVTQPRARRLPRQGSRQGQGCCPRALGQPTSCGSSNAHPLPGGWHHLAGPVTVRAGRAGDQQPPTSMALRYAIGSSGSCGVLRVMAVVLSVQVMVCEVDTPLPVVRPGPRRAAHHELHEEDGGDSDVSRPVRQPAHHPVLGLWRGLPRSRRLE